MYIEAERGESNRVSESQCAEIKIKERRKGKEDENEW